MNQNSQKQHLDHHSPRRSQWPLWLGMSWPLLIIAVVWLVWFAGEDIDARDAQGWTPLMVAADAGDYDRVVRLVNRGAEVDALDNCGWTPMMRAAAGGHLEIMEWLLEQGADLHQRERTGYNALMAAVLNNQADTTRALLRHGAEVNGQENSNGLTALMWAVRNDNPQMVEWLLDAGADPSVRNQAGETAAQLVIGTEMEMILPCQR